MRAPGFTSARQKVRGGNVADFFFSGIPERKNSAQFSVFGLSKANFFRPADERANADPERVGTHATGNDEAIVALQIFSRLHRNPGKYCIFVFTAGEIALREWRCRRWRARCWKMSRPDPPEKYFCKMVDIAKSRD